MPFVGAPTDTFVALVGDINQPISAINTVGYEKFSDAQLEHTTTTISTTGYEKFADNQPEHSTKINTGPGVVRTPKVITFKKEV